jgi:hypothetical protein
MMNYDPNAGLDMIKELPKEEQKGVPTGLLQSEPENKIEESQMADFSSPIEEVMAGPGQLLQDEVMGGPPQMQTGNKRTPKSDSSDEKRKSNNPFGMTDEQFQAALAGVVAVIAFSHPVQSKLTSTVPRFLTETSELSMTGMAVTALVAAVLYYFAKQYLIK